jgi:hypothetical protein
MLNSPFVLAVTLAVLENSGNDYDPSFWRYLSAGICLSSIPAVHPNLSGYHSHLIGGGCIEAFSSYGHLVQY